MTAFLPPSADIDVDSQIYDNVYQSSSNQLVSGTRVLTGQCAKINLPNKSLGSQTTIDLPHNMLLGHTTLNMVFKTGKGGYNGNDKVPVNAGLPKGWGYDAVDWIEYQFANSERLRIEGTHMLIKNLADVESGEKKDAVLDLGGEKWLGGTDNEANESRVEAYVSLYLPFSNLSSSRVIPYDSSILSRPVQITIQFKPARDIFKASVDAITAGVTYPQQFFDAYVMCKTMVMIDGPSDSIAQRVSLSGDQKYTYGYLYPLAFSSASEFTGVSVEDPGKASVKLERFLNGSLQSIDVFCERLTVGNAQNARYKDNSAYSRLANLVPITNAQLIFSGQCIWRSDDRSDQLMNLSEYPTTTTLKADTFPYSTAIPNAASGYGSLSTTTGYWLHIQLSQLNERVFTNLTETGVVLVSNQVLLEFNTPELKDLTYDQTAPVQQPQYRLHCVYNYQAGVRTAQGSTNLVFQPPQIALPSVAGVAGPL